MALLPKEAPYPNDIPRPDNPDHQSSPVSCSPEKDCYTLTDEIAPAVRVSLLEEHLPWEKRDGAYEPIERPYL